MLCPMLCLMLPYPVWPLIHGYMGSAPARTRFFAYLAIIGSIASAQSLA